MHCTSYTFPTLRHLDRLSANGNTTAAAHGVTVPKYFVAAAACHAASCCVSVRPRARFLLATRHVKTGALKLRHVFSCNCAATSCTILCFLETALPRWWKRGEASCDYLKSRPGIALALTKALLLFRESSNRRDVSPALHVLFPNLRTG